MRALSKYLKSYQREQFSFPLLATEAIDLKFRKRRFNQIKVEGEVLVIRTVGHSMLPLGDTCFSKLSSVLCSVPFLRGAGGRLHSEIQYIFHGLNNTKLRSMTF